MIDNVLVSISDSTNDPIYISHTVRKFGHIISYRLLRGGELMSVDHYYNLCCRYRGRAVEIRTHDGRVHRGIIENVNRNRVYIRPFNRRRNLGGFGYGFGGFWGYGGSGVGYGIALGTIIGLALVPFLFW